MWKLSYNDAQGSSYFNWSRKTITEKIGKITVGKREGEGENFAMREKEQRREMRIFFAKRGNI